MVGAEPEAEELVSMLWGVILALGRPPAHQLPQCPYEFLPLSGTPFLRVWGRQHWFSVLGGPIHVSLAWAIGQGVGDTFPLVVEGCIFSPVSH